MVSVKAKEIQKSLSALVSSKVPVFLWGAPGVGKSSIVKAIAEQKEIAFIDLRLALMDPTDLKGIPFYDKESHTALWAPPAFLPREGEGILFLDELNSAAPAVQSSAYQLILDRRVGEYILPDGWAIVAAGNRESDRGVTYRMPAPLANRFVHFEMEVSVEDWREWAFGSGIDSRIIAYISYKNEALFNFDATKAQKSFATPRSWEYVDKILKSDLSAETLLDVLCGTVGKEEAVGFLSFVKVANRLPDIALIVAGELREYPQDMDVLYALSSGIVTHYLQNPSDEKLENILQYSLELKSEFAVLLVQDLQRNGVRMEHIASYALWVKKFAYLLV
jgi:MoxR-like ATPase